MTEVNLKKIQRARRRKDLLAFVEGSFPGYEAGWVHKDICNRLEKFSEAVERKESPRLILQMPPRHGKSYLSSENFPVWHIGKNPTHKCVVASYSADLSQSFSKKALDSAQSDYCTEIFPELALDEKRQTMIEWGTTKGGGYKSVGVGGSLTGHGADILIVDDPVKDWEEAMSARIRDRVWNWWGSTAYTRLMPGAGALVIMTRWHEEDLAGKLIAEMENSEDEYSDTWEIINYPAIAEHKEDHRDKGEALHPARFPLEKLKKLRAAVGERVWTSLYQQNPRPNGGRYINRDWFKILPRTSTPVDLRWCRGWDLAVQAKTSSDETASTKGAIDHDGTLYLMDQIAYKKVWGASKKAIVNTAIKEKITIGIENVAAMDIAVQEVRSSLRGEVLVKGIKVTNDKLTRAIPWIDLAEQGKVVLVEGDWTDQFLEQCEAFDPEQRKQADDRVDSVSVLFQMIKQRRKPRLFI